MNDLTRYCPICIQYLKLNEQMRHQPVRCPTCKGVLMPDNAPAPESVSAKPAPAPAPAPLPNLELDEPPPRPAPRPQKKEPPAPKNAEPPPKKVAPPKKAEPRPSPKQPEEPAPRPSRKQQEEPARRSRRDEPVEEDEPRRRPRRDEPEEDEPPRRKPKRDDPPIVRGRRLTKGGEDDDDDDYPPLRHRDDVPEDVMKRARAISLKIDVLPPAVREKIEGELADREKVVWIGRPYGPFIFVRSIAFFFCCFLGMLIAGAIGVVAFSSGGQAGLMAGLIALFVGLVAGICVLVRLFRTFFGSTTYVLTSRRALVIAWSIFGGYYATTYGPELAACPRIRRGLLMRSCGDLVMRTLIKTTVTHYTRSGNVNVRRSRTFFGFIGISNLDEVDKLCADTLGHYFKELVRPTAYWDFYDVMRYVGYAAVPVGLMAFCLFACAGAFFPSWFTTEEDYGKQAWLVQADPGVKPPAEVAPAKQPIAVGSNKVFYPHSPSPYVAIGSGKNKNGQHVFQIYDLSKWEKQGKATLSELEDDRRLALSPDGKLIAMRHRGKPTTMQFRGPDHGAVNFEVKGDPGWVIDQVEFASAGRIVIMAKSGEGASQDSEMRFLVYDANQRKQVCTGQAPRQFHPRYASFSAGGTFLAMVVNKGRERHLAFWDLRDGKLSGAIPIEEEGEPGGLAFSFDGNTVALLLKTGKGPGEWGRLVCWNLSDRAKVHNHVIAAGPIDPVESLHQEGGKKSLAWLPDGKGWLLFGHVVYDRDTGAVVGEVTPQQGRQKEVAERVFRGTGEVTDLNATTRMLGVTALPKR